MLIKADQAAQNGILFFFGSAPLRGNSRTQIAAKEEKKAEAQRQRRYARSTFVSREPKQANEQAQAHKQVASDTQNPGKMEGGQGDVAMQPAGQKVLASVLRRVPAEEVEDHYNSRLKDKKVQLANPDRARSKPDAGSNAAKKLSLRDKRARRSLPRHAKSRAVEKKAQGSSGGASSSRKRPRGVQGLDESTSYSALLPLHHFWVSYVHQFLGLLRLREGDSDELVHNPAMLRLDGQTGRWRVNESTVPSLQQQACKADLVGATIEVTRANNPALVGLKGIVAKETEHTFMLANESEVNSAARTASAAVGASRPGPRSRKARRQFKVVPKHDASFDLLIPLPPPPSSTSSASVPSTAKVASPDVEQYLHIPLSGNQMQGPVVTRATRKWKQKKTMEF
ncbi:unnamed protein product [Jaminaea pallidilutea]